MYIENLRHMLPYQLLCDRDTFHLNSFMHGGLLCHFAVCRFSDIVDSHMDNNWLNALKSLDLSKSEGPLSLALLACGLTSL